MIRRLFAAALMLTVVLGIAAVSPHQTFADSRDFTLYNNSSYVTIVHVYVSPSYVDNWENDVLGRDVLFPGDSADIQFTARDGNACFYDIRLDGDDGTHTYDNNVNLCVTDSVTFSD